ncbi:hypothetical protein CPT_Sigurd_068 [Enterococcus phage Sigurd]|nr:hypothetical protein CPT_Sigurd_068 [Enterococcus phage Sigurd]
MNKLPREVELKIWIDDCNIECCTSQMQLRDPDITIAEMKRLESRYEVAMQKREKAYLELYKLEGK